LLPSDACKRLALGGRGVSLTPNRDGEQHTEALKDCANMVL
jgi:hypothetical protein